MKTQNDYTFVTDKRAAVLPEWIRWQQWCGVNWRGSRSQYGGRACARNFKLYMTPIIRYTQ